MAYREVGMWEILDVLRRVAQGQSKSEIKRATGLRRKTIRRYKSLAEELGWIAEEHEPSEELAAEVYDQLRGGGCEGGEGETEKRLHPHRDRILAWLRPEDGGRGLRLTKVHRLLVREGVIGEAEMRGTHIGLFMRELLAGDFPWAKLRQAQKLLRLGNKYGWERVDQACRRARAFDAINVRKVERIITQGLATPRTKPATERVVQLPMRFARDARSFSHNNDEGDDDDRDTTITQDGAQEAEALGPDAHAPRPGGIRTKDETR
jgi:hypothetical protein